MTMTIENLWKVNATITMFLALVTGVQLSFGNSIFAVFAAFSTGFALATTIVSVYLDIEAARRSHLWRI